MNAILEMAQHKNDGRCRRLSSPGASPSATATSCRRRFPRSTSCSAPARCRRSSRRSRDVAAADPPAGRGPGRRCSRAGLTAASPSVLKGVAARHREAVAARALPTYLYDASTPRIADDAAPLRVRQGGGGLRLQLRLLHHPDAARPVPQPARRRIVREARQLAARGVKELLLISQDTTFYGIDRRRARRARAAAAALNGVEGLEWIRLLYLYPTTITDDVLDAMAACHKVCRYIDLPLQHSADSVLKRMRRPGHARVLRAAARPHPRARARRHAAHDLHRGLPRRDRRGVRRPAATSSATSSSTTSASSPTRTRRARPPSRWPTTCRRGVKAQRRDGSWRCSSASSRAARPRRVGERVRGAGRRPVARARARGAGAGSRARRRRSTRSSTSLMRWRPPPGAWPPGALVDGPRSCERPRLRSASRRPAPSESVGAPGDTAALPDQLCYALVLRSDTGRLVSGPVPTFSVLGASRHVSPGADAQRIRPLAERVVASHGLDIFDVQLRRESVGWVLRVVIDRPPVRRAPTAASRWSRSSAASASRSASGSAEDLGTMLDVEDAVDGEYTLEVSSPGIDRPLRGALDYERFARTAGEDRGAASP